MASYLDALPGGVDAYPAAQVKGAVLRMALEEEELKLPLDALPPAISAHITDPPTVNAWVSEVHFNATILAAYDAHFVKAGGGPAFDKWISERNRRLLKTPLFRILFAVMSPERLLVGVEKRWAAFRRGTEMTCLEHSDHAARLSWRHPRNLTTDLSARGLAMALRVSMELAGARDVSMQYELAAPDTTTFRGSWRKK